MILREDILKIAEGQVNGADYHVGSSLHKPYLVLGTICDCDNPRDAEVFLCGSHSCKVYSIVVSGSEQQVGLRRVSLLQDIQLGPIFVQYDSVVLVGDILASFALLLDNGKLVLIARGQVSDEVHSDSSGTNDKGSHRLVFDSCSGKLGNR